MSRGSSSQSLLLKATGLYTHPNPLGSVPEGALSKADNAVIDKEGILEPRRGVDRLPYSFSNVNDRATKLINYQSLVLAHYTGDKLARYDVSTGWIDYPGTYTPPTGTKIRTAESNSNLYITTASGVYVLDSVTGTPATVGCPQGLDVTPTATGASGFLPADSQCAYRVVWGIKDTNNNLVIGAPSGRGIAVNVTAGTQDVSLVITIPDGITTAHFFQVYRSAPSATASTEPTDELGLVYEANPTGAEITAKSITVVDATPDSLRGATLYTSQSQEGILQSNYRPPLAQDIAAFKSCLFYGNTISKHRKNITMLSVGAPAGLQIGDILTIAGTTYTAAVAENIGAREFLLASGGTPSQNIDDTARSLVKVINQSSANTLVYAYYQSGYGDLPGKVLIEERGLGGSAFSIICSAHGSAFNPALPTSGTSVASANDTYQNALSISKAGSPWAVPLTNVLFMGSASKKILRIIPLRDSLMVLKEDGIYRISGVPGSFNSELMDATAKLISPESAVVLNNQIFALTDQGIVAISDTGVSVMSRPIEISLLELFGANLEGVKDMSFGVSYESERKYILYTITDEADTYPTQAFVFNTFTNAWTRWTMNITAGVVNPADDKLYLAKADSRHVVKERKSFNFTDYIDEGETFTLGAVDDKVLTISGGVSGIEVGDLVYQTTSRYSPVISVDIANSQITVNDSRSWVLGATTIYKSIPTLIEWVPQTGGNPGVLKHFREMALLFSNNNFPFAKIGFYSDLSGSVEETDVTGTASGLWGLFPWGESPWGGLQRPKPIRTFIPLEKSRCSQLSIRFSHSVGYSLFRLTGVSVQFSSVSERMVR